VIRPTEAGYADFQLIFPDTATGSVKVSLTGGVGADTVDGRPIGGWQTTRGSALDGLHLIKAYFVDIQLVQIRFLDWMIADTQRVLIQCRLQDCLAPRASKLVTLHSATVGSPYESLGTSGTCFGFGIPIAIIPPPLALQADAVVAVPLN
jgi:hypothetical protein